jgi:hypothetical protein
VCVPDLFHVTTSRNRKSIQTYGLDWRRMGAARGIAASREPEQEGSFLCVGEFEMEWFVGLNNTGGPVDVWAVEGVDPNELVESPEGRFYFPSVIAAQRLTLWRSDCAPRGSRPERAP